jgi:hypothetical protein
VHVISTTSREDDLEVIVREPEVVGEEVDEADERALTPLEHLRVGRRLVDTVEVVAVEVEDEVGRQPPLLVHRSSTGGPILGGREVHVSGRLVREERPDVAEVDERFVSDHRGPAGGPRDVAPLARLGRRREVDAGRRVVRAEPTAQEVAGRGVHVGGCCREVGKVVASARSGHRSTEALSREVTYAYGRGLVRGGRMSRRPSSGSRVVMTANLLQLR